jgi:hypothetical protein
MKSTGMIYEVNASLRDDEGLECYCVALNEREKFEQANTSFVMMWLMVTRLHPVETQKYFVDPVGSISAPLCMVNGRG